MRRFPLGLAILAFVALMTYIGVRMNWHIETSRIKQVADVTKAPSRLYASMLIRYDKPPIYEEEYKMQDIEGVSKFSYRIRSYNGEQITLDAPPAAIFDVSFFFGRLVQDGVWKIVTQPDRGNTDAHYTVYVKQVADFKQGDRTVRFTDPHYWATVRRFDIDLSKDTPSDLKNNPGGLLKLQGTDIGDKRYQQIVDDFRAFGPESFRAKIAAERKKLGAK